MPDYPNARDCEHGHLRRKCEICALDREIKTLKHQLQLATDQLETTEQCHRCSGCARGAKMTLVLMREVEDAK